MLKRLLASLITLALYSCGTPLHSFAQMVTLTGTLQSANGLAASNYGITFTPSQVGFIAGSSVIINTTTACATSTDGSVVGLPNPLQGPQLSVGFTGTLPAANYYVVIAFYDAAGAITLVSPETVIQLNSTGRVIVAPPASGLPAGAVGMKVYVSTTTNTETLQGTTTGTAAFLQSIPLVSGAAKPSSNATLCKQVANDAIWPSGTGYTVSLTDTAGNTLPGYPMMWQLMGPNSTINLSNGLPYYHGTVYFPTPILASPLNHNLQSISGPLSLAGYNLTDVGSLGCGTSFPAYSVDCPTINARTGFLLNGAAPSGHFLIGNGTYYLDAATIPASSITGLFYQRVKTNGTPLTQRGVLNFYPRFAITDVGGETLADLANAGTAGTYANPTSITTDQWGRVTGVTAGGSTTPVSRTCSNLGSFPWSCYTVAADGTITAWGASAAITAGSQSTETAIAFPVTFTSTTGISIAANPDTCSSGSTGSTCGGNYVTESHPLRGSVTTTGFTAYTGAGVPIGGGGGVLTGTIHVMWSAKGF